MGKTAVYALTGRSPQELESSKIKWQDRCQISPKLEGILTKMMSRDLQQRYSRAIDVLTDLRPLLKIKQTVGARYAITHYLGGNAGIETYLADNLHRQYQSPCLIKQVELPSIHGAGNKIERRFAEELSILERLGYHDQIPQIWDHFVENDEFYLVQEYIQGEDLAHKIKQQLSVKDLVRILASTLSVLSFIHQNRIIHRNIKPSNIMIRYEDGQVVITDFGILKDIKTIPNLSIEASQDPDKLNYWAPEQIAGRPTIGSDLYALGMSIIEALTAVKSGNIPRDRQTGKLLWQQNFNIDRRLVKIIDKMVDLDLGQRYQSAEKVLADLQRIDLSSIAKQYQRTPPKKRNGFRRSRPQLKIFLAIGLLGVACLLGSVEYAFPTVRPLYHWYRGNKLLPQQPQAALNFFTKAIDLKPKSAKAWMGRGDALYSLELYAQALEAYSEAARLEPTNWKNWQQQGNALYYLEQYREAIAMYNRALELHKEDGEIYNYRGKALYELQDYESALIMQEEALAIDRFNAEFLSDRAKNLIALDKYFDALTVLNRVQVSEPYNMKLWQDKALVLEALNRPQEAARVNREIINNYDRALQKQPRNADLWLSQGDFWVVRQMYDRAIESYEQAINLKPNFYRAWLAKAKALSNIGQNQDALDALDKALEIRPKSYKALQAKGSVYQRDLESAIASYDRGIAINSEYAPLWRDRGLALNQQGNYSQAIESLTKASQLAPQDAQTWVGLATALDAIGKDSQALSALDRALKLQPNDMDIWSQKGQIQTKNAQYNEACDTYRQSRSINPNYSIIINSMQSLGCRMN